MTTSWKEIAAVFYLLSLLSSCVTASFHFAYYPRPFDMTFKIHQLATLAVSELAAFLGIQPWCCLSFVWERRFHAVIMFSISTWFFIGFYVYAICGLTIKWVRPFYAINVHTHEIVEPDDLINIRIIIGSSSISCTFLLVAGFINTMVVFGKP